MAPIHCEQLEVVDHDREVVAAAVDGEVLVLAESGEVERLAVDQEAVPVHGDGAHAERLRVDVDELAVRAQHLDLERVQVAGSGAPQLTPSIRSVPSLPSARVDLGAAGIAHPHPHWCCSPPSTTAR